MPTTFIKAPIIITFLLLCSSCGYRTSNSKTICVPFVSGDCYGKLTDEIIRRISESTQLNFCNSQGDYSLKVQLVKLNQETIGYRKDQEKDFTLRDNIIASEGRFKAVACISLIDNRTCQVCFGPSEVSAYVDYDYVDENSLQDLSFINENGQRVTVLDFSIGQLESEESARFAAEEPLFKCLAEKIVDAISIQW